jgi:hypothetical protein
MTYAAMRDSDRAKKYLTETIARDPDGFYASLAKGRRAEVPQVAFIGKK